MLLKTPFEVTLRSKRETRCAPRSWSMPRPLVKGATLLTICWFHGSEFEAAVDIGHHNPAQDDDTNLQNRVRLVKSNIFMDFVDFSIDFAQFPSLAQRRGLKAALRIQQIESKTKKSRTRFWRAPD